MSLGGWLLLEPGPSKELFARFKGPDGREVTCEWDLMTSMRQQGAISALWEHRERYLTLEDFRRIRAMGLNAVRVPFGYWAVVGASSPSPGAMVDPYEGPALEYLDRAVNWAEECGLQVLLDLHGCPGGESGEAPCGRHQPRPGSRWHWTHWRFAETLKVLRVVAERYRGRPAVRGLAVCNEPSPEVPLEVLCHFYDRATATIREAGMSDDRVTVVLPAFQRSVDDLAQAWEKRSEGKHQNTCFEVHWYHCFENEWHGRTFAQHLRAVQEHTEVLHRYPVVVGEWSLALGFGAQPGKLSKDEMRALFAHAQLAAYQEASHGWFFWTWNDQHGIDWDWRRSYQEGYLPLSEALHPLPELPPKGEDERLEAVFDAPASDPRVRLGDTVYLRAFNGRYLDVEGSEVRARYGDRGKWQQFVLCPLEGSALCSSGALGLRSGDVACLLAHNGRYLQVVDNRVKASARLADHRCALVVHMEASASEEVRHRSVIFLQSRETSKVLAPNESEAVSREEVVARWEHFGLWQRLVVEKPLSSVVTPRRPRRRASFPGFSPAPRKSEEGGGAFADQRSRNSLGSAPSGQNIRHRRSTPGRPEAAAAAAHAAGTPIAATPARRRRSSTTALPDKIAPGTPRAGAAGGSQAGGASRGRRSSNSVPASARYAPGVVVAGGSQTRRRRSSTGAVASSAPGTVAAVGNQPRRQRSIAMAAVAAPSTPRAAKPGGSRPCRRRSSTGTAAAPPSRTPGVAAPSSSQACRRRRTSVGSMPTPSTPAATPGITPGKRQRSVAATPAEVAAMATPARRRRGGVREELLNTR